MRALFVFMLAGSLIFAQSDSDRKIRIEGRVVSTTGEPVRKADVRLVTISAQAAVAQLSDDSGKFVFEDLKTGTYKIRAKSVGFLAQFYGSKVVNGSGMPLSLK